MSTETTNKKIKIDNGTTFGRTYTDKAVDERLQGLVSTATFTPVKEKANNSLQNPAGLTKTELVGVGTNGQENIEIGDNLTLANGKLSATGGSGGEGGISVIELTDKNGTIASTQLSEINANPQNFAFKYNGKILLFTSADSTTYQYCNNTTSSSDNNVMTTSTLLTITSSTGAYTIAENVHNVVANSIHPANGGDLTNIQVGSKVYSIPSGGGKIVIKQYNEYTKYIFSIPVQTYEKNKVYKLEYQMYPSTFNVTKILAASSATVGTSAGQYGIMLMNGVVFITQVRTYIWPDHASLELFYTPLETVTITEQPYLQITIQFICEK